MKLAWDIARCRGEGCALRTDCLRHADLQHARRRRGFLHGVLAAQAGYHHISGYHRGGRAVMIQSPPTCF